MRSVGGVIKIRSQVDGGSTFWFVVQMKGVKSWGPHMSRVELSWEWFPPDMASRTGGASRYKCRSLKQTRRST